MASWNRGWNIYSLEQERRIKRKKKGNKVIAKENGDNREKEKKQERKEWISIKYGDV